MKFPFQRKKLSPLEQLANDLPPGGRAFKIYEGEQLPPDYVEHPGDVSFVLVHEWRPEDEPIKAPLEAIPGYQRPVNWKQIQERSGNEPGRVEIV